MAVYHHQASSDVESSKEVKEWSSTEHLETFARSRDQVHGRELLSARAVEYTFIFKSTFVVVLDVGVVVS